MKRPDVLVFGFVRDCDGAEELFQNHRPTSAVPSCSCCVRLGARNRCLLATTRRSLWFGSSTSDLLHLLAGSHLTCHLGFARSQCYHPDGFTCLCFFKSLFGSGDGPFVLWDWVGLDSIRLDLIGFDRNIFTIAISV